MGYGAKEIFLHYLLDPITGQCYYRDSGGRIQFGAFKSLRKAPEGWLDSMVSFGRSSKYFGINRSFGIPLKFVDDGADIIRYLMYKKRGLEQPLQLIILKWNPTNDVYELYYKGLIDMPKAEDDVAESVTVSVMEGGVVQLLKAFENTVYQIPCDGSIPENIKVKLDGILFNDVFHYSFIPLSFDTGNWAQPCVFLSNEGDNVGIIRGDQSYQDANTPTPTDYANSSSNFLYSSLEAITVNLKGTIKMRRGSDPNTEYALRWYTSKSRNGFVIPLTDISAGDSAFAFDLDIALAKDERLFLIGFAGFGAVEILEGSFDVTFSSKYKATETWGITAYDLFRLLVHNINQSGATSLQVFNYLADSQLLFSKKNLVVCSGDALRAGNDPSYPGPVVIKTSVSDFFDSLGSVLCGALSNQTLPGQNESLFFEGMDYVFDSSVVTMDLPEVSDFKVSFATEYYFNALKIGFPTQQYDEKAGKYEYNTTAQFTPPIKSLAKELSRVSKYRADSYGIEYTRFSTGGKDTAHNSSDNSVFIINVADTQGEFSKFVGDNNTFVPDIGVTNQAVRLPNIQGDYLSYNQDFTVFTFAQALSMPQFTALIGAAGIVTSGSFTLSLFVNGILLISFTQGPGVFIQNATQAGVVFSKNDVIVLRYTTAPGTVITLTGLFLDLTSEQIRVYPLRRTVYDSITGIPNPDTAFNIDDLTPARLLQANAAFLKGTLWNLSPDSLKFQTLDRNQDLSTTLAGKTITENASVPVNSLAAPLFYGFIFTFKTKVPLNFMQLMNGAANGHIRFPYNGVYFYGFPLEVSQKPALNESQQWKLLCSPMTILADLADLDIDGLNFLDMAGLSSFIPHLCPVHFVPLGFTNPDQYHNLTMDQDWFKNRITKWIANNDYFNPWQTNDIIRIQMQTNALGPVQAELMDCSQNVIATIPFNTITSNAVKNPYILWQGNINLAGLTEGLYYLVITCGTGTAITKHVSEGLWVKDDWPETLLFEYSNSVNKQAVVFDGGYTPSFRVEGRIVRYEPGSKFAVHEDQLADIELLDGISYDTFNLEIGKSNGGVPDYVIRKLNRIMLLTSTNIDGPGYTRNGDSKWERVNFVGQPREYWSLNIRFSDNRDGITVTTDGEVNQNISIVYNIDAAAFGENSGVSNVIQVEQQ